MSKAFMKVMSDIKKQKVKQQKKKQSRGNEAQDIQDDMSSSQQKRLQKLGVLKKKIRKETQKESRQWRHDRFKEERQPEIPQRSIHHVKPPSIMFEGSPGYNKIFPIVKHLKIYIRQIDDRSIVFNQMHAFHEAKRLFVEKGLLFRVVNSTNSTTSYK